MKSSKADQLPGHASPRRGTTRRVIIGIILAIGVTCFALVAPVVMVAMVMVNASSAIGEGIASAMSVIAFIISLIAQLAELLWLLHVGEHARFAMRVLEVLTALGPR